MSVAPDWAKLRADFPILDQQVHGKPLIYFDNATTSQKARGQFSRGLLSRRRCTSLAQ